MPISSDPVLASSNSGNMRAWNPNYWVPGPHGLSAHTDHTAQGPTASQTSSTSTSTRKSTLTPRTGHRPRDLPATEDAAPAGMIVRGTTRHDHSRRNQEPATTRILIDPQKPTNQHHILEPPGPTGHSTTAALAATRLAAMTGMWRCSSSTAPSDSSLSGGGRLGSGRSLVEAPVGPWGLSLGSCLCLAEPLPCPSPAPIAQGAGVLALDPGTGLRRAGSRARQGLGIGEFGCPSFSGALDGEWPFRACGAGGLSA